MGNFSSVLSLANEASEVSIGKIDDSKMETPTRFRRESQRTDYIDPRSPTVDIDRTPILLEKPKVPANCEDDDPRSPTVGITRTPMAVLQQIPKPIDWNSADITQDVNKETQQLMQVLDFTEQDSLSVHSEDEQEPTEKDQDLQAVEEPLEFSLSSVVSSTPAPSPVKSTSVKTKLVLGKENNIIKNQSPSNLAAGNRRIPFGEVNRSATSSPRLQLQNRQKLSVRTVIQSNSIKLD